MKAAAQPPLQIQRQAPCCPILQQEARGVAFVWHFAQAEPAVLPTPANCLIPHLICLRMTENVRQRRVYKIIN